MQPQNAANTAHHYQSHNKKLAAKYIHITNTRNKRVICVFATASCKMLPYIHANSFAKDAEFIHTCDALHLTRSAIKTVSPYVYIHIKSNSRGIRIRTNHRTEITSNTQTKMHIVNSAIVYERRFCKKKILYVKRYQCVFNM